MPHLFAADAEFCKLLAHRDDVDLVTLMLELASDAYPSIDRAACRAELDRLAGEARARLGRLPSGSRLRDRLTALSDYFCREAGFAGNENEYYEPANSYINEVLRRRLGIPISLAMVYQAIAARAGVTTWGIGAPGHFVLAAADDLHTWYIDVFAGGRVLTATECCAEIGARLNAPDSVTPDMLPLAQPREIAARILRNLKAAYAMRDAWPQSLPVQQRLALLLPDELAERRDLGLIYLRNAQPRLAYDLLTEYVQHGSPDEQTALQPFIGAARRMLIEMN